MLTSATIQSTLDDIGSKILANPDNKILRTIYYSTQTGMNMLLELAQAEEGVHQRQPNKGQACAYMMANTARTGTYKALVSGQAYRFDKQWFRDNLQNGALDLRTVYFLTEQVSGVILTLDGASGSVNFQFFENDPTSATLNATWDALV